MADERTGHRSLADQLRSWPEDRLRHLLTARSDLATPTPHDFGQLASRAAVRTSIANVLDGLTRGELSVIDALVVAGQTTESELTSMVCAESAYVLAAVERLRSLALAWDSPEGLRALSGVADVLASAGRHGVSGLRPRSPHPRGREDLIHIFAALPPPARDLLTHVVQHGGVADAGTARLGIDPEQAQTPAEHLIAHRLLVASGAPAAGQLVVPGEVALASQGGCTTTAAIDQPPAVATEERSTRLAVSAAVGAATEVVRRTEALLDSWDAQPAAALRTGGLGVRELRAATTRLQCTEAEAALVIEVAAEAQMIGSRADADGNPVWVPTDEFDQWREQPTAQRWVRLARAWLNSARLPAHVGSHGPDRKPWNTLTPGLSAEEMPEAKQMTLAALAALPLEHGLDSSTGLPSLVARIAWERPRRTGARSDLVASAVAEAAVLGITGAEVLSEHGRALLQGADAAAALAEQLPTPVEHVLLQADLTAVAPGPLEPDLARRMGEVAEVESAGTATVYRFSPGSLRHGFDLGWTPAEMHAFLAAVSRTPVPQPLTYLVDDVARQFGRLRVGVASAFIRSEDDAALAALINHPQAEALRLRRIAPTVVVAGAPIDVLLPRLRALGLTPVLEGPDGAVRVGAAEPLRARHQRRSERAEPARGAARRAAQVTLAVQAILEGEEAARTRPASASAPGGGVLSALREAIERRGAVLIGFTDKQGLLTEREVQPLAVEGGQLTARDAAAPDDDLDAERRYAVHRIRKVAPLN
ncbi:MAG: helicase-associated domain-containing protein [Nocardioidaceae bacterium]|nr:helicase-associated domain-containing protein [Nocardioidaceae bacterium]